jgi:hypothetical protein
MQNIRTKSAVSAYYNLAFLFHEKRMLSRLMNTARNFINFSYFRLQYFVYVFMNGAMLYSKQSA